MAIVAAKCTQCGANIEIDDSKDAGNCAHCGTAFVTQKVIHNYNTFITKNIVLDEDLKNQLLSSSSHTSLNATAEKCQRLYELRDFDALAKLTEQVLEKWPLSYIGYKYSLMGYQLYSRRALPEYEKIVKHAAKAGASLNEWEHVMQPLLKKMLERMTDEERFKEREFIADVQRGIGYFLSEKVIALKKRPVILGIWFAAFFLLFITFVILTPSNILDPEGAILLGSFGIPFTVIPAVVLGVMLINSIRRLQFIKPMTDEIVRLKES
ncbi:MAG: zinc ribbon domain-containing protein [Firmicutes bacterium]|nr:zinc ribbon domain-containing protein [Bacillota bacterium]